MLFTVTGKGARIAVVSLANGKVHHLLDGNGPRFSPTGHLLFAAARTLRAVGFDARRLQVIGNPVTVVERVGIGTGADFDVADSGSLVYATDRAPEVPRLRTLVWMDRQGREEPIKGAPPAALHAPPPVAAAGGRARRADSLR